MTFQEFEAAFNPVAHRFKRSYNGDVMKLIFDVLKGYSHYDGERLAKHLNGTCRVAPMIPDITKAIQDLGIRPIQRETYASAAQSITTPENHLYHIRENIWADNTHIFIRGPKPAFILKADHPGHPFVQEDSRVRSQKIDEVRRHIENKTYGNYLNRNNSVPHGTSHGLKKVEATV